jgi:hypothetical protein
MLIAQIAKCGNDCSSAGQGNYVPTVIYGSVTDTGVSKSTYNMRAKEVYQCVEIFLTSAGASALAALGNNFEFPVLILPT